MIRPDRGFMLFGLAANERSWRGVLMLIYVYIGALIFAAIFAPWLYKLVWLWYEWAPNSLNEYLAYKGFEDYFDRLRWIPVLLALPWMLSICRMWPPWRLGLHFHWQGGRQFRQWFLIGTALTAFIALAQQWYYEDSFQKSLNWLSISFLILKSLTGGIILGFLEEAVFRGLILRLFYTAVGPLGAILLCSLFFSYAHFKMPDHVWQDAFQLTEEQKLQKLDDMGSNGQPPPDDKYRVTWWSGFFVAYWTLFGISEEFQLIAFLNYFFLGIVLAVLTLNTRSLMAAIGLHAGVVFAMLSYKRLVDISGDHLFWGGGLIVDGLGTLVLLIGLTFAIIFMPGKTPSGKDY